MLLVAVSLAAAQTAAPPFELALRASAALELATRRARDAALKVADDVVALRRRGNQSEGVTLMILGGAAVVVGAMAGGGGGTVLVIGGLVCAGYGVYLYTQ